MLKNVTLDKIYKQVAKELSIPEKDIKKIYEAFWLYIKTQIQELPLKKDISEEEFNHLKLNYRVAGLGTFHCKFGYEKLQKIRISCEEVRNRNEVRSSNKIKNKVKKIRKEK